MLFRMTVQNFVRIAWTIFDEIEKSRKMAVFLSHFWANFRYVSHIPLTTILMPLRTQGPFWL